MQLEFSRFIEDDLDEVADFIAEDNPLRAVTFIKEIRSKFNEIQRNPLAYQLRPDIGDEARMATLGNYAILFRVIGEVVRIERVAYGSHDLPNTL
jgi:plasmid stabilization system protein ParE